MKCSYGESKQPQISIAASVRRVQRDELFQRSSAVNRIGRSNLLVVANGIAKDPRTIKSFVPDHHCPARPPVSAAVLAMAKVAASVKVKPLDSAEQGGCRASDRRQACARKDG